MTSSEQKQEVHTEERKLYYRRDAIRGGINACLALLSMPALASIASNFDKREKKNSSEIPSQSSEKENNKFKNPSSECDKPRIEDVFTSIKALQHAPWVISASALNALGSNLLHNYLTKQWRVDKIGNASLSHTEFDRMLKAKPFKSSVELTVIAPMVEEFFLRTMPSNYVTM